MPDRSANQKKGWTRPTKTPHDLARLRDLQPGDALPRPRTGRLYVVRMRPGERGCRGFSSFSVRRPRLAGPSRLGAGRSFPWTWGSRCQPTICCDVMELDEEAHGWPLTVLTLMSIRMTASLAGSLAAAAGRSVFLDVVPKHPHLPAPLAPCCQGQIHDRHRRYRIVPRALAQIGLEPLCAKKVASLQPDATQVWRESD